MTALPATALISDWYGHGLRHVDAVLAELARREPDSVADFTAAVRATAAWNAQHDVGTAVEYQTWPDRERRTGVTTTAAYATVHGMALLRVHGYDGGVELDRVQVP